MYEVRWSRRFRKDLKKLPRDAARRILERVAKLAEDPFLGKPLRGVSARVKPDLEVALRSLRVGDYRVIYVANPLTRTVYLLTVEHRKRVYEGL